MAIGTETLFGVIGIVATVVASHVRLAGKQETFAAKIDERLAMAAQERGRMGQAIATIQAKVSNGAFVRREDCTRCREDLSRKGD